jgi:uncharacterized small protein (DUF1192 family)
MKDIEYIEKIQKVVNSLEFPEEMSKELKFYNKFRIESELKKIVNKIQKRIKNEEYMRLNVAKETIAELNNKITFLNSKIESLEQEIKK